MATMNPYLNFGGNTEEAFNFYRSVIGGQFTAVHRYKDMPGAGNISEDEKNKIMHISLPIGNGNVLMATDVLESMGQKLKEGNNFYIALTAESREEADELFEGLSEGGDIEMPMEETFWGSYFGSFKDKFGVGWMIDYALPQ